VTPAARLIAFLKAAFFARQSEIEDLTAHRKRTRDFPRDHEEVDRILARRE